ncbi:unnamed protein product [Scytosiphon promiscuus]
MLSALQLKTGTRYYCSRWIPRYGWSGTTGRTPLLFSLLIWFALAGTVGIVAGQASRLAILVSASSGAIERALPVSDEWPRCTFSTKKSVDLLFNFETTAEEDRHAFSDDVDNLARGLGSRPGNFSTMHADLEDEENAFPLEVRDSMFNETFLGSGDARPELAVYDALAVMKREHVVDSSNRFVKLEAEQEPNQEAVRAKSSRNIRNAAFCRTPDSGFVEHASQTCTRRGLREPDDKAGVGSVLEDTQGNEAGATVAHGGGGGGLTTAFETTNVTTAVATPTSASPPAPTPTAIFHGDYRSRDMSGERREQRKRGPRKARHARKGNARKRKLDRTSRETCEEHESIDGPEGGDVRPDCSRNDKKHTDTRGCGPVKTVRANSGCSNIGNKWPKQERWREERKYGCLP